MADVPEMRVLGFPVTVKPAFVVTATVIGLGGGRGPLLLLEWVAVLFAAVLAHELGHALALRSFGHRPSITFGALGGVTSVAMDRPDRPGKRLIVILAGPVVGLALGLLFLVARASLALAGDEGLLGVVVTDLAVTNLGLAVFNLVPVLPLDGGQAIQSLVDGVTGGRGLRPALVLSTLVAGGAVVAPLLLGPGWLGLGLIGIFLCVSNARSLFLLPAEVAAAAHAQTEANARRLIDAYALVERRDTSGASIVARDLLDASTSETVRVGAANLLVWTCLLNGRTAEAVLAAESAPAGHPAAPLLHESVLRTVGGVDRAIALLQGAFDALPGESTGVLLARGLVEAGHLGAAIVFVTGPDIERLGNNPAAIVGAALFGAGRFEDAARVGESAFERHPHPALAYNVACAWVRGGNIERALRWLGRAVDAGYHDLAELENDPLLEPVRARPDYAAVRRRVAHQAR